MSKRVPDRRLELRARFSEVFLFAGESGPRRVTKHGQEAVGVLPPRKLRSLPEQKPATGLLSNSLRHRRPAIPALIWTGRAISGERLAYERSLLDTSVISELVEPEPDPQRHPLD